MSEIIPDPKSIGDYIFIDEGSTWITVGAYSIKIRSTQRGLGINIRVFELGHEDEDHLDSIYVDQADLELLQEARGEDGRV